MTSKFTGRRRTAIISVRVVGAQHSLAVGDGLLAQRDRLGRPPRRLVGESEVVREVRVSG